MGLNIGNLAIHLEFPAQFSVDVVVRYDLQFTYQYQEIVDIRQLDSTILKAIKLIKYAVGEVGLANKISSYTIERDSIVVSRVPSLWRVVRISRCAGKRSEWRSMLATRPWWEMG